MEQININLPYTEDPKGIINTAIKIYKNWLDNGIHYELDYVYYKIEDRSHDVIIEHKLPNNEMIDLYPTLGDWMENEYTGHSFINFPRFDKEIFNIVDEWVNNKFIQINKGIDDEVLEEWLEENYEKFIDCRDYFQYEVIGSISTNSFKSR